MPISSKVAEKIVVAGGGMVGAAAALSLARLGHPVTLIDRHRPQDGPRGLGIDIRNVALSPGSHGLLAQIEAWPARTAPYQRMDVWEQWGAAGIQFDAKSMHRDELGWLVEVAELSEKLWSRLDESPLVNLIFGDIAAVGLADHQVELTVVPPADSGSRETQIVPAELLLAADGSNSSVRSLLGVATQSLPTHQVALTTVVKTTCPHGSIARQRFLLDGPLACLPSVDPHISSIVWSQSPAAGERRLNLSEHDFKEALGLALEYRLGRIEAVAERFVFPLNQQLAETPLPHPRVVLLGDAFRVVHPLAGQGVNLGFEDIRHLLPYVAAQRTFDQPGLLSAYARRRHRRSQAMIDLLGGLRQIYAQASPAFALARNVGVGWVNGQHWLKRKMMFEAMGLTD
tara:strand:+ start:2667 stop:3866 length:1200 start_codon:yes stop_codon:yes gene_type:complete